MKYLFVVILLFFAVPALAQQPTPTGQQYCGQMVGNMTMQITVLLDEVAKLKKELAEAKKEPKPDAKQKP